ncbi:hypothetical protein Alg130_08016 [Pyrenophora tritici-repentis]|nr:hypothetical protein PtrV1_09181 [Pyrenophora tritici-repentis]KAI0572541.1 hypothetical protein Alg215_09723 [Pyrenophora tritici-repentis]KAI0578268.1 hypothetical protein Alg130_08016 [Pyrenophora tritici-repentis]
MLLARLHMLPLFGPQLFGTQCRNSDFNVQLADPLCEQKQRYGDKAEVANQTLVDRPSFSPSFKEIGE